ncbi:hypothetical protein DSN37_02390 [Salmonella enterica subsp. enterica serovar Kuessel]|nr:hypothetical protein [Salmonella enterica subsp. houtenae serovar 44:z4,z23:-]EBX5568970.1 hypothetical protein [Salmonella enterica subsp. enterica serovar Kuessel]
MVFGNEFVEGDGFKLVLLWGGFSEHGGQSVFCTDLIRSKSGLFSQDFVSSLSASFDALFILASGLIISGTHRYVALQCVYQAVGAS